MVDSKERGRVARPVGYTLFFQYGETGGEVRFGVYSVVVGMET